MPVMFQKLALNFNYTMNFYKFFALKYIMVIKKISKLTVSSF